MPILQHRPSTLGKPLLHRVQEADPTPRSHLQTHLACSVQGTWQRPRSHDAVLISPDWLLVTVSCRRADNAMQPQLPQQVLLCRQALLADVALCSQEAPLGHHSLLNVSGPIWLTRPSPFPPFLGSGKSQALLFTKHNLTLIAEEPSSPLQQVSAVPWY